MTTIAVSQETKEFLTELKKAVKKVTGKKITYDEAVLVLVDAFKMTGNDGEDLKNKLYERALTLSNLASFSPPNKEEIEKYYHFVPEELFSKVRELSKKLDLPPAMMLVRVLEDGLKTYENLFYQLPEDLSREFVKWWGTLPKGEQEKVVKHLDKKLSACFRGEFLKLKKKFKAR